MTMESFNNAKTREVLAAMTTQRGAISKMAGVNDDGKDDLQRRLAMRQRGTGAQYSSSLLLCLLLLFSLSIPSSPGLWYGF